MKPNEGKRNKRENDDKKVVIRRKIRAWKLKDIGDKEEGKEEKEI